MEARNSNQFYMLNSINSFLLRELKKRTVIVCGFAIVTKKDCRILSELIELKVGMRVSETTIYRLFIATERSHSFYSSTLSILAQFVEFESWRDFEVNVLKNQDILAQNSEKLDVRADPSIWDTIFKNQAWSLVTEFFESIANQPREDGMHSLGWLIYTALKRNPLVERDFYDQYHANAIVRTAFFEFAADPDIDLWNYDYGIERYLAAIPTTAKENQLRDYVFAHSLMVRRDFSRLNLTAVNNRFETFLMDLDFQHCTERICPIYPLARLLEARWLYYKSKCDWRGVENVKQEALIWIDRVWDDLGFTEQKALVYCVLEAARLTTDQSDFVEVFCERFRPFIEKVCGNGKDVNVERILQHMEFNGLKLQIKWRESISF